VPKIIKIQGEHGASAEAQVADRKLMDVGGSSMLTKITRPEAGSVRKVASKACLRAFKLRAGSAVWLHGHAARRPHVLRFLDRLISIELMPRIPDFRGVSARSFDGRGNYSTAG
jgi:large subunit ribosomal protein L5